MSRKNDMFNLFYVLIFLLKNDLPWLFFVRKNCQSNKLSLRDILEINDIKANCNSAVLCKNLPSKYYILIIRLDFRTILTVL